MNVHLPKGTALEQIPEYFKVETVEKLARAHPVLLVRQMANEILRLRKLVEGK